MASILYWIKLPERTSSRPSGHDHVGLYKAMHVCIPNEEAEILQNNLATMFLQMNNICNMNIIEQRETLELLEFTNNHSIRFPDH